MKKIIKYKKIIKRFVKNRKFLATLLFLSLATGQAQAFSWSTIPSYCLKAWTNMSKDAKSLTTTIGLSLISTVVLSLALNYFSSDNDESNKSCNSDNIALKKNKENEESINSARRSRFKSFLGIATAGAICSPLVLNFKVLYTIYKILSLSNSAFNLGWAFHIRHLNSKYPLTLNSINGNINESRKLLEKMENKTDYQLKMALDTAIESKNLRKGNIDLLLENGAKVKKRYIDRIIKQIEEKKELLKIKYDESIKKEDEFITRNEKEYLEKIRDSLVKKYNEQRKAMGIENPLENESKEREEIVCESKETQTDINTDNREEECKNMVKLKEKQ